MVYINICDEVRKVSFDRADSGGSRTYPFPLIRYYIGDLFYWGVQRAAPSWIKKWNKEPLYFRNPDYKYEGREKLPMVKKEFGGGQRWQDQNRDFRYGQRWQNERWQNERWQHRWQDGNRDYERRHRRHDRSEDLGGEQQDRNYSRQNWSHRQDRGYGQYNHSDSRSGYSHHGRRQGSGFYRDSNFRANGQQNNGSYELNDKEKDGITNRHEGEFSSRDEVSASQKGSSYHHDHSSRRRYWRDSHQESRSNGKYHNDGQNGDEDQITDGYYDHSNGQRHKNYAHQGYYKNGEYRTNYNNNYNGHNQHSYHKYQSRHYKFADGGHRERSPRKRRSSGTDKSDLSWWWSYI